MMGVKDTDRLYLRHVYVTLAAVCKSAVLCTRDHKSAVLCTRDHTARCPCDYSISRDKLWNCFFKCIFASLTGGNLCQIFILQNPRVNKIKKRIGNKNLFYLGRSQWLCGLKRGAAAARLLIL
jgi:hypothetical protein